MWNCNPGLSWFREAYPQIHVLHIITSHYQRSRQEAALGLLLQVTVLSRELPTAVTLTVCYTPTADAQQCTSHPMAITIDAKTGHRHSQVYEATVPVPMPGGSFFLYFMTADFAEGEGPSLRSPVEGNTTVTVM